MHSITQIEKKVNRKIQKKYFFLCWFGIHSMTFGGTHGGVGGVCKLMKQDTQQFKRHAQKLIPVHTVL